MFGCDISSLLIAFCTIMLSCTVNPSFKNGFPTCLWVLYCFCNFIPCCRMAVESISANLSLVVHRDHATFGAVSAFCYAQSVKNGATQNEDFSFVPQVIFLCSRRTRKHDELYKSVVPSESLPHSLKGIFQKLFYSGPAGKFDGWVKLHEISDMIHCEAGI